MNSPSYTVRNTCIELIAKATEERISLDPSLLELPPTPEMGDLAFPCFVLAKELKKSPVQIAKDIAEKIIMPGRNDAVERVEAAGPYVNFFLNPHAIARMILENKDKKNEQRMRATHKIVIEYISPNTNKPLHIGHARNGALGDALARLNEYRGTPVVRALLVNDRGIHICKSMVAYKQCSAYSTQCPTTPKEAGKKSDHFIGDYYVLYGKLLEKHPEIEERAKECLLKWEDGDKITRALWKRMNTWALSGMKQTAKRLGWTFDKTYYESDIYASSREIILQGLKRGIFKRDETGAVYADLEPFGLPNKILLRRDGTSLYITQDIFLAYKKSKDFSPTASIYVVASEQDLYFKQLFAVLKLLKVPYAEHLVHASYGMVRLPEGRIKSREGTTVDIDNLMDELVAMVKEEIIKRSMDPRFRGDDKEVGAVVSGSLDCARDDRWDVRDDVNKRSEAIALAALKYYLLTVSPHSDMIFNPKESIALHGKTGPYLLYTYARLRSITRRAEVSPRTIVRDPEGSKSDGIPRSARNDVYGFSAEKPLVLALMYFDETIKRATDEANPSLLANYLYDLAQKTNDYYHAKPVLKNEEPTRTARLLLIDKIADTLKIGLALLGIETIEKM